MENNKSYCVETQMQIRKPVSQVFNAFIDPALTKEFWFTKGSGKLAVGKTVTWTWEMYNHSAQISEGSIATLTMKEQRTHKSTYKELAVQWLNEVFCFVASSVVAESFVLRNHQLLVAAERGANAV